jgi:tRNA threonylcarbamoyladenosine biosynthesis protein TsaB
MRARILAIDTTSEFGSLALLEGGALSEQVGLRSPDGFGHVLFDEIGALLARHERNIRDIDCFASASGPGSFTGVRIGLTAAKGLAEATGSPAVAVSNLKALATFGSAPLRAVFLDARRGEIYGAVYDAEGNEVVPERVLKLEDWLRTLPGMARLELISPDLDAFAPALPSDAAKLAGPRAIAAAVGRIALAEFETGRGADPAAIDANYVRRSDAEILWKES